MGPRITNRVFAVPADDRGTEGETNIIGKLASCATVEMMRYPRETVTIYSLSGGAKLDATELSCSTLYAWDGKTTLRRTPCG